MGDKPISFKDENGNFVSAADVWNADKLEALFNELNPNRKLRLEREKKKKTKLIRSSENNKRSDDYHQTFLMFFVVF